MKTILQIRTRPNDELAEESAKVEQTEELRMEIIELAQGTPDYEALLESIFRADRIQVW